MPSRSRALARTPLTNQVIEPLVRGTLEGDKRAWHAFWLAVDPRMEEIAGRWRVTGRLSDDEEERRNVVVLVMGRLEENRFARLARLHEVLVRGEVGGWPWISAVTRRTALNYARGHSENPLASGADAGRRLVASLPVADGLEEQLPESARAPDIAEVHRIQAYAEQALKPHQWRALCLWHAGYEYHEIAKELGLAGKAAVCQAKDAAVKRLRYQFAGEAAPAEEEK
jgi:hypothetical protein